MARAHPRTEQGMVKMELAVVSDGGGVERIAYSVAEVAAAWGTSKQFVYDRLNDGTLRSVKVGGRRLIPVRAVEEYLGNSILEVA